MIRALFGNEPATSYHGHTIETSVSKLRNAFGEETCIGTSDDKVQHEWVLEHVDEHDYPIVFTIYDWKEYRDYSDDETIEFHIGYELGEIFTKEIYDEIVSALE